MNMKNSENKGLLSELLESVTKYFLIIEDDKDMVALIKHHLEKEYPLCEFIEAYDGATGLKLIKEKYADLIILDIMMPALSGLDILRKLKESDPAILKDVPILILTAKNDYDTVKEAMDLKVNNYLIKPFQGQDLIKRVKNLIDP